MLLLFVVLKLMAISAALAATSAFAERTFSLARRIKMYMQSQMTDESFWMLSLLSWYGKDKLDKVVDLVQIRNKFLQDAAVDSRKLMFGTEFTPEDFVSRQLNHV
jgi:hypothetical protein